MALPVDLLTHGLVTANNETGPLLKQKRRYVVENDASFHGTGQLPRLLQESYSSLKERVGVKPGFDWGYADKQELRALPVMPSALHGRSSGEVGLLAS